MKRLVIVAVCAMAVMISCKNKGKTEAASLDDSISAVIDSIIEETDTTPLPMFLMGDDDKYAQMLYWTTDLEEPQKTKDNEDWFDQQHKSWALQDMFRRNMHDYTNMLVDDKVVKIKFVMAAVGFPRSVPVSTLPTLRLGRSVNGVPSS